MDSGDDTAEGAAGRSDSFRDLDEAADSAGDSVWEQEAAQEEGLHITARVNTGRGVRCRAVADTLPAYVQPAEPSLEDAYLYLIHLHTKEAAQ